MRTRQESLEFALLGLLEQGSAHGYELRKRLVAMYGPFRAISFSVLYPQLKRMMDQELIEVSHIPVTSRRSKILYSITKQGRARLIELNEDVSPTDWDDDTFEVRFSFFKLTKPANRVLILEGRKRRLLDKADALRAELAREARNGSQSDSYLVEWRKHSLESLEREIEWLGIMTQSEREIPKEAS
jgi:DNA-binding PadR family transcriptional regulator